MNQPKVYISILNWNGLEDTLECLESVFKMDYPHFEVIVVDNGSTDDSVEVIEKTYPQLTLIENKENLGFTGGNNIAMHYAMDHSADYVWLLNNDTIVEPDTLSKLVTEADKSPDIGLVSPVIYYYDEPEKIQFHGSYVDWKNFRFRTAKDLQSWHQINIGQTISLWGTALLVKRAVIENIGYLNSKYFAYHEDGEYCIRATKSGYMNVVEPNVKVYHKDSRSTGNSRSPMQVFLRVRNIYFLWMSNLRGLDRFAYLRKFMAETIAYSALLREKNLNESADACFDGAWCALQGKGGTWNRNINMPIILKKIFSWHPYFWANLLKGNFSSIASEVLKRGKAKIFIITGQ